MSKQVQIDKTWYNALEDEFSKDYFIKLTSFLKKRKAEEAVIFPPGKLIFNAFNSTPLPKVKVVILGQDPYHGINEAHGLCFSVQKGIKVPPSLRNIYKELQADIGAVIPNHGELTHWAQEGVFLLNSILTVEQKKPASHKDKGWEQFTDKAIKVISEQCNNVVFILWGAFARSKASLIDSEKHLVLEAPHPAAEIYAGGKAGFFGSRPFSKSNDFLTKHGIKPVVWSIDS